MTNMEWGWGVRGQVFTVNNDGLAGDEAAQRSTKELHRPRNVVERSDSIKRPPCAIGPASVCRQCRPTRPSKAKQGQAGFPSICLQFARSTARQQSEERAEVRSGLGARDITRAVVSGKVK